MSVSIIVEPSLSSISNTLQKKSFAIESVVESSAYTLFKFPFLSEKGEVIKIENKIINMIIEKLI